MTTADLLRDLVRLPSVNPMGRAVSGPIYLENRVTDYLSEYFANLGVRAERQPVAPQRENVVARYDAGSARTVVFEVHQDTVPVDGMTIDPFGGEIRDGRLYGRGACDVKGGMAAMIAAFTRLARERPKGAANVVLACTVDEEHTFLGVQRLAHGLKADMAVVAEPTQLKIVHAHKGVVRWTIQTAGRSCHSSRPDRGVNAVYRMGKIITAFERYADRLARATPDPLLGKPTVSIGRIEGGLSVNTIPDFCRVEVDRRLLPGEDGAAARRRDCWDFLLRQTDVDVPFSFSDSWLTCPALPACTCPELMQRMGTAIDSVVGQHEQEAVPYGTDASTLALAGIPSVVFGPGDIAQAHTADEWIELGKLDQAAEILFRFATSF